MDYWQVSIIYSYIYLMSHIAIYNIYPSLSINSSINYNFYHLSVFITLVLSMSVLIVGLVVLGMSTRLEYRTSILKLWKPRTDIPIPVSYFIKWDYMQLECMSSASVNNTHRIYNQNQEPNPTGNILLTLDSKRQFVVLVLCVLLITRKA